MKKKLRLKLEELEVHGFSTTADTSGRAGTVLAHSGGTTDYTNNYVCSGATGIQCGSGGDSYQTGCGTCQYQTTCRGPGCIQIE